MYRSGKELSNAGLFKTFIAQFRFQIDDFLLHIINIVDLFLPTVHLLRWETHFFFNFFSGTKFEFSYLDRPKQLDVSLFSVKSETEAAKMIGR